MNAATADRIEARTNHHREADTAIVPASRSKIKEDNLYIQQTTAHDRLTIERALDGAFISLDRAHSLLEDVLDGHFGGYEKQAVSAHDAEMISDKLEIVGEIIFNALLAYSLTIGRGDFRGVAPYLESAERAALAVKIESRLRAVFPGSDRTERRKEIMGLSDKEAIAILEKEGAAV